MSSEAEHDDAPGDEPRILPGLDHACEVVQRRVDVAPPHGLDEGADHVVVLVAVAVVPKQGAIDRTSHDVGGDHRRRDIRVLVAVRIGGRSLDAGALDGRIRSVCIRSSRLARRHGCGLERRERSSGVAGRQADDGGSCLGVDDDLAAEPSRVGHRAIDEDAEVVVGEEFEREQQRTRQQRRDHRERRILGGGRDEDDPAVLDARQQRVLLGLREPVDLVEEEHGRQAVEVAAGARLLHDLADVAHPRRDRGELDEVAPRLMRDRLRQGRLSRARRPPEDDGDRARLAGAIARERHERRARREQMTLARDLVEARRAHAHGERRRAGAQARGRFHHAHQRSRDIRHRRRRTGPAADAVPRPMHAPIGAGGGRLRRVGTQ